MKKTDAFSRALVIQNYLISGGIREADLTPWNYDTGTCRHIPTGTSIYIGWSDSKLDQFLRENVSSTT